MDPFTKIKYMADSLVRKTEKQILEAEKEKQSTQRIGELRS
jgi:hypothetical protein